MTLTDNQYDLALNGRGFFQVLLPSGETGYTRAGNFSVNDQGQLVTTDGYLVQPTIAIPQGAVNVTISKSGQVQVTTATSPTPAIVGQLQLSNFMNEGGLEARGGNLFMESAASGAATNGNPGSPGFGQLMQGFTEASNVDAVSEITALIVAQRAYEMNSKVVTTADQMLATASNVKT